MCNQQDYLNVCRICLKKCEIMFSIFEEAQTIENSQLKDILEEFISVSVHIHEDMTTLICCNCSEKLEENYKFRKKCIQSELMLKKLVTSKSSIEHFENSENILVQNHFVEEVQSKQNESRLSTNEDIVNVLPDSNSVTPSVGTKLKSRDNTDIFIDLNNIIDNSQLNKSTVRNKKDNTFIKINNLPQLSENTEINDLQLFKDEIEIDEYEVELEITDDKNNKIDCKLIELIKNTNKTKSELNLSNNNEELQFDLNSSEDLDSAPDFTTHNINPIKNDQLIYFHQEVPFEGDESIEFVHVCKLCQIKYKYLNELETHINTHHQNLQYQCDFCNQLLPKFEQLQYHIGHDHCTEGASVCTMCFQIITFKTVTEHRRTVHPNTCFECNIEFAQKANYKMHLLTRHNYVLDDCDVCNEIFWTKKQKDMHRVKCIRHTCKRCPAEYLTVDGLIIHLQTEHNFDTLYYCELCNCIFESEITYKKHVIAARHENQIPFCNICEKIFDSEEFLQKHMTAAHECRYCSKLFVARSLRTEHYFKDHKDKFYQCNLCDGLFNGRGYLEMHVKVEHEFKCRFCLLPCYDQKTLDEHKMAVHSTDEGCSCYKCGRKMKIRESLLEHLKRCEQVYECLCDKCGKPFYNISALERHYAVRHPDFNENSNYHKPVKKKMKKSSDKELAQCYKCGLFRKKSQLSTHMQNHEKQFLCNICGKSFTQNHSFQEHVAKHSGRDNYKCPYCDETFSFLFEVWSHKKLNHQDKTSHRKKILKRSVPLCKFCKKKISPDSTADILEYHASASCWKGEYQCSVCNTYLSNRKLAREHLKRKHPDQKSDSFVKFRIIRKNRRKFLKFKAKNKPEKINSESDGNSIKDQIRIISIESDREVIDAAYALDAIRFQ